MKKKLKTKNLRQYSLVKVTPPKGLEKLYPEIKEERFLVFLGEIPNMKGHSIVLGYTTGRLYVQHTSELTEVPEEDV